MPRAEMSKSPTKRFACRSPPSLTEYSLEFYNLIKLGQPLTRIASHLHPSIKSLGHPTSNQCAFGVFFLRISQRLKYKNQKVFAIKRTKSKSLVLGCLTLAQFTQLVAGHNLSPIGKSEHARPDKSKMFVEFRGEQFAVHPTTLPRWATYELWDPGSPTNFRQ
ncbi:hypothetical protein BC629DRAFT_1438428 [Irpex lacteus]|nr:hypothetical protein BC629DRAFT_1438428 [Irpex lacteus]